MAKTRPNRRAPSPSLLPSAKRRRLGSREGTVTTSLAIPRPVHQQAMVAGVRLNWTFAEVVREALMEWLARHDAEPVAKEARR